MFRTAQFGSGLSSVLKGVSNTKFAERSIKPAEGTPTAPLRSDCATVHTGLAIEPTQLPHTLFKQRLTSVLLHHVLHETLISRRPVGVGNRAALRTATVFPGLPGLLFWPRFFLLEFPIAEGGGAGWAAVAAGQYLVTESWLLGAESPASLIRL